MLTPIEHRILSDTPVLGPGASAKSKAKQPQAPTMREYARAAELREALRLFQRRTEEVTAAQGLTPRTYQLLLMIKTSRTQ